jgi:hypothetical protein
VKLTVTDNDGATDSVTKTVTVTAPTGPLAVDSFGRTTSNGWRSADTGGAWSRYGTARRFSVGGGKGKIIMATPGTGPRAALESVSSTKSDTTMKVSLDKVANGGGACISVGARTIGTNDYRAKVKVASTGALTLYLTKVISNTETTLTSVNLGSAFNYTAGATLQIRVQAVGTSPTTVRAKAWKTTQTEPTTWQLTTTDSSAELQAAGGRRTGHLPGHYRHEPVSRGVLRRPECGDCRLSSYAGLIECRAEQAPFPLPEGRLLLSRGVSQQHTVRPIAIRPAREPVHDQPWLVCSLLRVLFACRV